jgi:hypothetical protein
MMVWIYSEQMECTYKVRVFRTGRIGLPGTKPHMIDDIVDKLSNVLVPMLRDALARDGAPIRDNIALVSLEPIMKDYKWSRILDPDQSQSHIIDLHSLDASIAAQSAENAEAIVITFHQHKDSEPKLAMCLRNPQTGESMRVSIFRSGKINILGAKRDMEFTKKVCNLIARVITPSMIVAVGCRRTIAW